MLDLHQTRLEAMAALAGIKGALLILLLISIITMYKIWVMTPPASVFDRSTVERFGPADGSHERVPVCENSWQSGHTFPGPESTLFTIDSLCHVCPVGSLSLVSQCCKGQHERDERYCLEDPFCSCLRSCMLEPTPNKLLTQWLPVTVFHGSLLEPRPFRACQLRCQLRLSSPAAMGAPL